MTDCTDPAGGDLVCVDPEWGNLLWRLDEPDLEPAIEKGLQDHLFICDACRQSQMIHETLVTLIQSGEVQAGPRHPVRRPVLGWASMVALAASLALIFVLPPTGRDSGGIRRGDEQVSGFVRPVEGEVLRDGKPTMSWAPIAGASSYRVQISEVGGDYEWSTTTEETSVRVPDDHALPDAGLFRGVIRPVPADLSGPVDVSVAFSRAGWSRYLVYRAGAAPRWLFLLGGLGTLGAVLTLGRARRTIR